MSRIVKTAIRLLAVVVAATAATLVIGASPALAVTNCSDWQKRSYDLPNKPDGYTRAAACVQRSGNYLRAYIKYELHYVDGRPFASNHRFDKYLIRPRLERYDEDYATFSCDITDVINGNSPGTGVRYCYTGWRELSLHHFTGDGSILSDVDNDGKGSYSWALHGSPVLY